ncbi:hypothetical protein SAMN05444858_103285 [Micromonospora avicenniae]|uniref:Uncharacterized protein n=1 Tax=Micromonospora avicenniae TaxID=1198245 RepID=A0A1N6UA88_9ACTN|nr:hypothetical protein SAMN05444858_103285 [Micromonospora avicenniae]
MITATGRTFHGPPGARLGPHDDATSAAPRRRGRPLLHIPWGQRWVVSSEPMVRAASTAGLGWKTSPISPVPPGLVRLARLRRRTASNPAATTTSSPAISGHGAGPLFPARFLFGARRRATTGFLFRHLCAVTSSLSAPPPDQVTRSEAANGPAIPAHWLVAKGGGQVLRRAGIPSSPRSTRLP